MGITVIPALSGKGLPGAAPAAGAAEIAGGAFASLLSGELLSQIAAIAEPGEAAPRDDDGLQGIRDIPDSALLASLFGQAASADIAPRHIADAAAQTAEADGGPLGAGGRGLMPELPAAAPPRPAGIGLPAEKALKPLAGANADGAAALRAQMAARAAANAANIAAADEVAPGNAAPLVANHLAASATAPSAGGNAPNAAQPGVAAPLHSPVWPQQFGDKIVWLSRNEQQVAQLSINPPQLGPVQVTLNMSGGQVNLAFASPHAEVRQVIENAMPQLKEMLATAGIDLGQADIGANLSRQRDDLPFGDANGTRSAHENAILPASDKGASAAGVTVLQRGRGLVDLFA